MLCENANSVEEAQRYIGHLIGTHSALTGATQILLVTGIRVGSGVPVIYILAEEVQTGLEYAILANQMHYYVYIS